eukprot:SAG25_NODE_1285_length_3416_cov_3.811275_4_plen_117_part_00
MPTFRDCGCLLTYSTYAAGEQVAEFLLMRGPWAYLGTGWVGCAPVGGPDAMGSNDTNYSRPVAWDRDYGVPLGLCRETSKGSGIFAREWSKATVSIDCKTAKTRIVMKTSAGRDAS